MGVVVSYYNPAGQPALRTQTELCAIRAFASQDAGLRVEVLVSDGSGQVDAELKARLDQLGIGYLSTDAPLAFGPGYNQGLRHFAERPEPPQLLATCANDVFCDAPTLPLLAGALLTDPGVGCAIPYLSQSDYLTQNAFVAPIYRRASSMTLNLNVFRTADLATLGFISEALSGYFNDTALMIGLRRMGKYVVIINGGNVVHLGRTTTSASSMARADQDRETFRRLFPAESKPGAVATKEEQLAAGKWNQAWYYLQCRVPRRARLLMMGISALALHIKRIWYDLRQS